MNAKLSGISRQMTRLLPKCVLNLADSLERCTRSMTKKMSAQAKSSGATELAALWLKPAQDVAIPEASAKTCSAVGRRSLLRLHMKRTIHRNTDDPAAYRL